jgi:hypothetical protein
LKFLRYLSSPSIQNIVQLKHNNEIQEELAKILRGPSRNTKRAKLDQTHNQTLSEEKEAKPEAAKAAEEKSTEEQEEQEEEEQEEEEEEEEEQPLKRNSRRSGSKALLFFWKSEWASKHPKKLAVLENVFFQGILIGGVSMIAFVFSGFDIGGLLIFTLIGSSILFTLLHQYRMYYHPGDDKELMLEQPRKFSDRVMIGALGTWMSVVFTLPLVLFHYFVFPMLTPGLGWSLEPVMGVVGLMLSIATHLLYNHKLAPNLNFPLGLLPGQGLEAGGQNPEPSLDSIQQLSESPWKDLSISEQDALVKSLVQEWRQGNIIIPPSFPCALECLKTLAAQLWNEIRGTTSQDQQIQRVAQEIKKIQKVLGEPNRFGEKQAFVLDLRAEFLKPFELEWRAYQHSFSKEEAPVLVLVGPEKKVKEFTEAMGIQNYLWVHQPNEALSKLKEAGDYVVKKVVTMLPQDWDRESVFLKVLKDSIPLDTPEQVETYLTEAIIFLTQQ